MTEIQTLTADYILLGTGSAGSADAAVLSEKYSVIAVEAGPNRDKDPVIRAPLATVPYSEGCNASKYYWSGISCATPSANNRQFPWTNGRLRGGGSSINGSIYAEGTIARFKEWEAVIGPEWGPIPVFEAYNRMKKVFGAPPGVNPGKGGPMAIRFGTENSTALPDFVNAILSSGVPGAQKIIDYNDPGTPIGVFDHFQYFQFADGSRASASRTFLNESVVNDKGEGINGRKLLLLSETTATRLVFEKQGNKYAAKAVYVMKDGKPLLLRAEHEIHVCMGFNSPAFLQVNGIGDEQTLMAAGVKTLIHLPGVGKFVKNNYPITSVMLAPPGTANNTNPADFYSGGAFLPDPRPGFDTSRRNVELSSILIPGGPNGFILIPVLESPLLAKSSGSIKINSPDPAQLAKVDMGFLSDPDDLETTAAMYQLIMKPIFLSLMAKGYILVQPSIETIDDPVAIREYIKNNIFNPHHYMCANRMAPREEGGVVNKWCKVYGTTNLRVVDDTATALNNDGNTNSVAELVGFRVAGHILEKRAGKKKFKKEFTFTYKACS